MQQQDPVLRIEQQDPGHLTHLDGFLNRTGSATPGSAAPGSTAVRSTGSAAPESTPVRRKGASGSAFRTLRPVA
ncbi:hypothetical protein [Streptomyces lunalinharesii]|uniref:Uncharacterized protein n=1 Tax=Streptomyces lunalinharesii TaxID=333384 RepID=A0ABP6DWD6_9ACTN